MNKKWMVLFLIALCYMPLVSGNVYVDDALHCAVTNGCMAQRKVVRSIEEFGAPPSLFKEPMFTNLVEVLSNHVGECGAAYVGGLTGIVRRTVFVAALTKCGPDIYGNSMIRWFGGDSALIPYDVKVIDAFIEPLGTSLEDYTPMHFDTPGISNVLNNARSLYLASSNTVGVALIDYILSGENKTTLIRGRASGLIDRIRDGSD